MKHSLFLHDMLAPISIPRSYSQEDVLDYSETTTDRI